MFSLHTYIGMYMVKAFQITVAELRTARRGTKGFFTHQLVLVETLSFVMPGLVVIKLALQRERHHTQISTELII